MVVKRAGDGTVVARGCELADTSLKRMRGLLGRDALGAGSGLWIRPCNSVHTWFMRFPIDVIFLDSEASVVRIEPELKPWRMTRIVLSARSVLELEAGAAKRAGLKPGDRLEFGE